MLNGLNNLESSLEKAQKISPNQVLMTLKKFNIDIDQGLIWAADKGHISTVELLIKNGANVNTKNSHILIEACTNGDTQLVQLLINHSVDLNAENNLALTRAAANGHADVVVALLAQGVDAAANDYEAMNWAVAHHHFSVIAELIKLPEQLECLKNNYRDTWNKLKSFRTDTIHNIDTLHKMKLPIEIIELTLYQSGNPVIFSFRANNENSLYQKTLDLQRIRQDKPNDMQTILNKDSEEIFNPSQTEINEKRLQQVKVMK